MTTNTAPPQRSVIGDAELAIAAANGDQAALTAIYHRYARRLQDYCAGMVRDHHAAADCVQDVFCTVAVELPKLREPDKLRPWLYAIARRAALRALRERRRESAVGEVPDSAATGPGPFTTTARNELAELITQVSDGLCERDRRVLDLAYRQGLSGPDLAQALGVTNESAKKLLQRLRDTVERSLGALLVARHADQHGCPQLSQTLAGTGGQFTVLVRKRIARHIESCESCGAYRHSIVNSAAILRGAILDKR
ncbi:MULTISPECIES: RNA polymerase sigma factor [Mycobacteriaceae]|jgi:RNA polymerase sigma factor (sigma-70 family)|uniref:RNA polymerase sigma factor, sigma-70 family n=1 Tax=Mycolicibacterium fluoranthenivorans TaxID=258505 RepID=A0A1G4X0X7_9MYCO|nr:MULTISPECIES: sigma-70 family RNA polymerase sigma factor [Mycobacteriaceae]MCV7250726.1 sigma-70 family RNA polymerase sigma factor [Mycobacterium hackensackense]SCX33553.1 RNA polymerase sigma factor, sigma-70 family [Mycolicibacterium fluoranthenivorans]